MKKEEFEATYKTTLFKIIVRKDGEGNIVDIMERPYGISFNESTSGAHLIVGNSREFHIDFFSGATPIKKEYPEKEGKKFVLPFWVNDSTWGFI